MRITQIDTEGQLKRKVTFKLLHKALDRAAVFYYLLPGKTILSDNFPTTPFHFFSPLLNHFPLVTWKYKFYSNKIFNFRQFQMELISFSSQKQFLRKGTPTLQTSPPPIPHNPKGCVGDELVCKVFEGKNNFFVPLWSFISLF